MSRAVFVVYNTTLSKIFVVPLTVCSKYIVIRKLHDVSSELSPEDRLYVRQSYEESPLLSKLDESDFYNGLSGDEIFETVLSDNQKKRFLQHQQKRIALLGTSAKCFYGTPRFSLSTAVPYERLLLPAHVLRCVENNKKIFKKKGSTDCASNFTDLNSLWINFKTGELHECVVFKFGTLQKVEEKMIRNNLCIPEFHNSGFMSDADFYALYLSVLQITKEAMRLENYLHLPEHTRVAMNQYQEIIQLAKKWPVEVVKEIVVN